MDQYSPAPELRNLRDDSAARNQNERLAKESGHITRPAVHDDTRTEVNGRPIQDFDDTPTPVVRFKRSQIAKMTPEQYREHRSEILESIKHGEVLDDITPEQLRKPQQSKELSDGAQKIVAVIGARNLREAAKQKWSAYQAALQRDDPMRPRDVFERNADVERISTFKEAWEEAESNAKAAERRLKELQSRKDS